MKVQIVLDGAVVSTQLVSLETPGRKPSFREAKRIALTRAIEDRILTISQSLKVSFRLFDVVGQPIPEEDEDD